MGVQSALAELQLNLEKYLEPGAQVFDDLAAKTPFGVFGLDLLIAHDGTRIGIVLLDRERAKSDYEWEAAAILGYTGISTIYHLRTSDLKNYMEDCLYLISQADPFLFSERGKVNLSKLVSDEAQQRDIGRLIEHDNITVTYYNEIVEDEPPFIAIERRFQGGHPRAFWRFIVELMNENPGLSLGEVKAKFRARASRP